MPRPRRANANGPYRHRAKFRVVFRDADGRRTTESYRTPEEAQAAIDAYREKVCLRYRTVAHALQSYARYLVRKGNRPSTVDTAEDVLRRIMGPLEARPLADICSLDCENGYRAIQHLAVATHRNSLAQTKTFWRWCVKQGWVEKSPIENVEPVGRRRRGKPQLRVDEARRFWTVSLARAQRGDDLGLAACLALGLGLRASEIVQRVVRDVDDGGRLLWITDAKTPAGNRALRVPRVIQPLLAARAKSDPRQLLIPRRRDWFCHGVKRLCAEANVPVVPAHGLRGTFATLSAEILGGVTAEIAATLGHTDPDFTARVYAAPGAGQAKAADRVAHLLATQPGDDVGGRGGLSE